MSNLTDIYDKIRLVIPTLAGFSAKTEIPNPYNLAQNNATFLREGYGVKIGQSTPQSSTDKPQYIVLTEFEIVLTERVASTSSNASPLIDVSKKIKKDIEIIENDFTATPLSTSTRFSSADKITYVNVVSSTGIGNLDVDKFNHITTSIIFGITHWK